MKRPLWVLYLSGICMGAADVVPGVSGGTMAWITGIYEELIEAITSFNIRTAGLLLRGRLREFFSAVHWRFLLVLLSGIATSILLLAHFIQGLLHDESGRTWLYSGFMGLILASIVMCFRLVKRWSWKELVAITVGTFLAFAMTQSSFDQGEKYTVALENNLTAHVPSSVLGAMIAKGILATDAEVVGPDGPVSAGDVATVRRGIDPWAVLCGALASSAMLLPGVSGAYLLQLLGMYGMAISALADFTTGIRTGTLDFDALLLLGSLLIGIVGGILVFSRAIKWMLHHVPSVTTSAICGFMIGALGTIWPFWSYQTIINPLKLSKGPLLEPLYPQLPSYDDPNTWLSLALVVLGFSFVTGLETFAKKVTSQSVES